MKLRILILLTFSILFTGCPKEPCEPVYIEKPVIVKVPQKCIVPEVQCDFNQSTYTEVIGAMLKCIVDYKESIKVCQ